VNALIFDCDGVLADTERDGHLVAFNATFEELGLPLRWSNDRYGEKLAIGGGKERFASELSPEFLGRAGIADDDATKAALVARVHERKTERFKGLVAAGELTPRSGVARLARDAGERGWRLAVASTSAEASVRSVLRLAMGDELASAFAVFAGDVVPKKKPAPDIYLLAAERLGVDPGDAVVVEDSRNGLVAATGAKMRCVVTLSTFTIGEDMTEATLVVSALGDPGGERSVVKRNRSDRPVGDYVSYENLQAVLAAPAFAVRA